MLPIVPLPAALLAAKDLPAALADELLAALLAMPASVTHTRIIATRIQVSTRNSQEQAAQGVLGSVTNVKLDAANKLPELICRNRS